MGSDPLIGVQELFILLLTYDVAVVILSVRGTLVRRCMIAAHSLSMTRGDFTFLDVEIVQVRYN